MVLIKLKRTDWLTGNEAEYISIRPNAIAFNSKFVGKANLKNYTRVVVSVDPEEYIIGFQFHNNEKDLDSFQLYTDSRTKNTRLFSARQLINKYNWVKSIAEHSDPLLKRFFPKFNSIENMWQIFLLPSFENKVNRKDVNKITSGTKGIYRYTKDKEIMYIGKGDIKSRVKEDQRKGWEFDVIEYSIIDDTEKQNYWESFWINRFIEINHRRPIYNKISGKSISRRS